MYDIEMQKLYLGVLLSDPELFVQVRNVTKSDFFVPQLRRAAKEILEYSDKYDGVPDAKVIEAKTGIEIKVPSKIDDSIRKWFMEDYPKFCLHKALENAVVKSSKLLEDQNYEEIEELVKQAMQTRIIDDYGVDYDDDPKERLRNILERSGNISSGFEALDKIVGKMNFGDLIIYAGGSGSGKSLFLQNNSIHHYVNNEMNVLYITLELHPELCARRIDSMLLGITTSELYNNLDTTRNAIQKITHTAKEKGNTFKLKYMPSGTKTTEIKAFVKDFMINTGVKPDVIAIDYLDLVDAAKTVAAGDTFGKDKAVSEELRNMGQEFNSLIITASQLNRTSVGQDDLDHSHIAGGISKINTADLVLGIITNDAMREKGVYELQVLKVRNSSGTGRRVQLEFLSECMKIQDNLEFLQNLNNFGSVMQKKTRLSETEKLYNDIQNQVNSDNEDYNPVDIETGRAKIENGQVKYEKDYSDEKDVEEKTDVNQQKETVGFPKELRTGMGNDRINKLREFLNDDDDDDFNW